MALLALCLLPALADASSIAVRRGQATVDPAILPLVCLEIGTDGIAMPVDSIVFENLADHTVQKVIVSNSFDTAHPDMLTAAAPGPISLSLPILRFNPGRYQIKSIDFVSGGLSNFTINVSQSANYWFEVKPGCVNYVGGIEIAADWAAIRRHFNGQYRANDPVHINFASTLWVRQTVQRDVKWACSVDPGMLALPLAVSAIHRE